MNVDEINQYAESILTESRDVTLKLVEVIRVARHELLGKHRMGFVDNILTQAATHLLATQLAWVTACATGVSSDDELAKVMHTVEEQVALHVRQVMDSVLPDGTTTVVAELSRKKKVDDGSAGG
jgi:uncharacterized damage-inducible protein DinB